MTRPHWAVRALGEEKLQRVRELMEGATMTRDDQRTAETAVLAHELALENAMDQGPEQVEQAAARLFDLRARLQPPRSRDELLELSCIARMGNRTGSLKECQTAEGLPRRGGRQRPEPKIPWERWDQHVEDTVRECWLDLLLQEQGAENVPRRIQGLLDQQGEREQPFLENMPRQDARTMAIRLVGLYHWAAAAGSAADPRGWAKAREHLRHAENSFRAQGDHRLELLLSHMGAMVETRERMAGSTGSMGA